MCGCLFAQRLPFTGPLASCLIQIAAVNSTPHVTKRHKEAHLQFPHPPRAFHAHVSLMQLSPLPPSPLHPHQLRPAAHRCYMQHTFPPLIDAKIASCSFNKRQRFVQHTSNASSFADSEGQDLVEAPAPGAAAANCTYAVAAPINHVTACVPEPNPLRLLPLTCRARAAHPH